MWKGVAMVVPPMIQCVLVLGLRLGIGLDN